MGKLSKAETVSYVSSIDAKLFPYFCAATGELAENLRAVLRETIRDLFKCGILHHWRRTANWQ